MMNLMLFHIEYILNCSHLRISSGLDCLFVYAELGGMLFVSVLERNGLPPPCSSCCINLIELNELSNEFGFGSASGAGSRSESSGNDAIVGENRQTLCTFLSGKMLTLGGEAVDRLCPF